MRLSVVATAICLSIIGISEGTEAEAATRRPTHIAAQGLAPALQLLAKERDVQVVYRSEVVGDRQTGGAVGDLTFEEALTQLLSGTGLTYRYLDDQAITILPLSSGSSPESNAPQELINSETADASTRSKPGFWNGFRLAQSDQSPQTTESVSRKESLPQSSEKISEKSAALGEVIVTATKRAENVQDVPMSITAIGADEIDRRGLVGAEDYLRGIPGVNQVTDFGGGSIIIRGIETSPTGQNFSSGATVATYFGETPTTNSAGLAGNSNIDTKLVDIERVEVLRGPQGTAFGNSSLGGAVRTIPVAPKLDQFEGAADASYSVTAGSGGDNYMIQGVGNVPLIRDKFAIRGTAYLFEDSGFYTNRAGSDPTFQAAAAQYGAQSFATDEDEVGSYYFSGGRIAAALQAGDDLKFTLSYLTQKSEIDGQPFANVGTGTYDQAILQVAPEHVSRGEKGGLFDTDIDIGNAVMEYDLGRADLLATFSHIESGATSALPFSYISTFNFAVPASTLGTGDHRENSGEIRLTTRLDGVWNFLVGLYAEELKDDSLYDYLWYGSPESNFFGTDRSLATYLDRRNLKQEAAFGEASWELVPRLTLTGGVRAYDYERTVSVRTTGFFGVADTTNQAEDSGTNLRSNLSYKLGDDGLVYAAWSEGFRLGKPQPGLPPGLCDLDGDGIVDGSNTTIDQTKSVGSDEVDNLEIGGKFALLDRRLIIATAVYRIDWTGVPVRVIAPCNISYDANAGEARSEGVELQASFHVTNAFRVDLGGSWIDARLTKDAPGLNASSGDRLPGSPEENANLGLQYEFDISGHKAFVRADSIYVGTFYGNLQQTADTKAGGYLKVDAVARVAIRDLNVELFVRNLTDADDFTYHGQFAGLGEFYGYHLRPRTIGFQLGYKF